MDHPDTDPGVRERIAEPLSSERERRLVTVDPQQIGAAPQLQSTRDDRCGMSTGAQRHVDDDAVRTLEQRRHHLEHDRDVRER
jgi:hypothetical protein